MAKVGSAETVGRRVEMPHVRFLINEQDPAALALAHRLWEAKVTFSTLPTSGVTALLVDGFAMYGTEAAGRAAGDLIALSRDYDARCQAERLPA